MCVCVYVRAHVEARQSLWRNLFFICSEKAFGFKQVSPDERTVVHPVMSASRQQMAVTPHCASALGKTLEAGSLSGSQREGLMRSVPWREG